MPGSPIAIHVRSTDRERCVAVAVGRVEDQGFELLDHEEEARVAPGRSVLIVASEGYLSIVDTEPEPLAEGVIDGWCQDLSMALGAPTVGFWGWEDEGFLQVCCFKEGRLQHRLELPDGLFRNEHGGVSVDLSELMACLGDNKDPNQEREIELADEAELHSFCDPEVHLFVPLSISAEAIANALKLPFGLPELDTVEDIGPQLELQFHRPGARSRR